MRRLAALLAWAVALAACDDPAEPGPRVVSVVVAPADTLLAPGDTVRFTATAFGEDDRAVAGVAFEWRSLDSMQARVDSAGLATALAPGEARVSARAPNGVRGFGDVRVRNVTGFFPRHGAFGEIVTVLGAAFDPTAGVRFAGQPAFVRGVAEDGRSLEAWVPVGAATGPITVATAGFTLETESAFFVTGNGDDALEPNDFNDPAALPFPFHNPSLVGRAGVDSLDADAYRFELPAPGPLRIELTDRTAELDLIHTTRFQLVDVGAQEIVGLAASVGVRRTSAGLTHEPLATVTISVPQLPAGTYDVLVSPFNFRGSVFAAGNRAYGLRIDGSPVFALEPDALEPNDVPVETPTITLPFARELALENAWSVDYFTFELSARAAVSVRTRALEEGPADVSLFLMSWPTKSAAWIAATREFPAIYLTAFFPGASESISATLEPGTYVIGVLDAIGAPIRYSLAVEATAFAPPAAPPAAPGLPLLRPHPGRRQPARESRR